MTVLNRGVHPDDFLSPKVERIHTEPHFLEPLKAALEGRKFDVVISTYGRLQLVIEAIKGHTKRLVSVGGMAVYKGWLKVANPPLAQYPSPVPVPEDGYLVEKGTHPFLDRMLDTEEAVMKAHKEGHFNVTHIRYCIGYGPRILAAPDWCIVRRILDGRKQMVLPQGGQVIMSKGWGENEAQAVLLAVDKPDASAGQIYNIADENQLTNREWVVAIAKAMNHEFEFIDMPLSIMRPGCAYAFPSALEYPYHQVMDITKIKQQLGYRDVLPAEKAIPKSVEWLLKNRPEPGGEKEKLMQDPFDYDTEDRLIKLLTTTWKRLREEAPARESDWVHAHAHPKKIGDLK
ncbi:MAG: hypothetical protein A2Y59_01260 [Chloroflexi bacterium RBG_13_52_14]|nr:MAG: hypothetical protein A2Y59_01260 [Chloroflexi bacterium RBG_13_52_14]